MNLDKYKSKGLALLDKYKAQNSVVFNKYKLESILVVLLGSSPVIIAGILFTLGGAFLPVVITAIAGLAGIFTALTVILPKIDKRRAEVEKQFFEKWNEACNSKDPYDELVMLIDSRKPFFSYGLIDPSEKQINKFLEQKDALGNTALHQAVLLDDVHIAERKIGGLQEYYTYSSHIYDWALISRIIGWKELDWNIQNNQGQTLVHILAERNEQDLAHLFRCMGDAIYKFDLSIKDSQGRTAEDITKEKERLGAVIPEEVRGLYHMHSKNTAKSR